MIVLDTHAWVWWVSNPELLSVSARKLVEKAVTYRTVFISSISAWELALLVAKGRLQLTMELTDWIAKAESLPFATFIPVNNTIAIRSVLLPDPLDSDPADRMIIATAITMGATLITKDERILSYPHVKAVW